MDCDKESREAINEFRDMCLQPCRRINFSVWNKQYDKDKYDWRIRWEYFE